MRVIPETQREAYEAVDCPQARDRVFSAIEKTHTYGSTLFELVRVMGWPVNRISGRVTELRKLGRIKDSGKRRINPESGAAAIVWEVAPCP